MKKLIVFLLSVLLCLTCCACGGTGNEEAPEETNESTLSTQAASATESTDGTESADSTGSSESTEPTQRPSIEVPGSALEEPAEHALFSCLMGQWNLLESSSNSEDLPFDTITFYEDGTCVAEGETYTYKNGRDLNGNLMVDICAEDEILCRVFLYFPGNVIQCIRTDGGSYFGYFFQ